MSEPEIMLTSGSASEETLHQRLRHLSEAIQRQLQETERRHREQLEIRIHHNTLLSADLNRLSPQTNYEGRKRAASTLAPKPDNNPSSHSRLLELSVPALISSSECKHHSTLPPTRTQHCERAASCKTTQQMKEEEAEAECKKKFSALPVPIQVRLPLYQEMMEQRDKERKQGLEQRKTFLLSVQKPFSFHQRENKRQDKLVGLLNQVSQDAKNKTVNNGQQSSPKQVKVPTDQERCRKIHISSTQQENHEKPKLRIADCTRMEKMGFLYEKPSFQPKINRQVPDFSQLHKALQTDGRRTSLTQDMTKCQPFYLRTSALPARQSKPTPEKSQDFHGDEGCEEQGECRLVEEIPEQVGGHEQDCFPPCQVAGPSQKLERSLRRKTAAPSGDGSTKDKRLPEGSTGHEGSRKRASAFV
ncbi:protein FAM161B isoform X2 [Phycodurus eques]|uniref:protein FAM161B isoform X2 n=1 Tax=Phycodurus eques TaxID=693459 RepID=UPI002ACDDC5F|nr:protein FAM161B isoform X2 [Phycodurus eques]